MNVKPIPYSVKIWGPSSTIFPVKSFLPFFVGSGGVVTETWTPRVDAYRPVPAGVYEARVYEWGIFRRNEHAKCRIDNDHYFDWFLNHKNSGNRIKVIWGRESSTHNLQYFNNIQIGIQKPQGADKSQEINIWSALLPYFENVVGTTGEIKFENIRTEEVKAARGSLDVFYQAIQVDLHGTSRKLELQMNRRLDGDIIKETPTSAYVAY